MLFLQLSSFSKIFLDVGVVGAVSGHLHFHMSFKISLSVSLKKKIPPGILIGGKQTTILSSLTHEQGMFLHLHRASLISLTVFCSF